MAGAAGTWANNQPTRQAQSNDPTALLQNISNNSDALVARLSPPQNQFPIYFQNVDPNQPAILPNSIPNVGQFNNMVATIVSGILHVWIGANVNVNGTPPHYRFVEGSSIFIPVPATGLTAISLYNGDPVNQLFGTLWLMQY